MGNVNLNTTLQKHLLELFRDNSYINYCLNEALQEAIEDHKDAILAFGRLQEYSEFVPYEQIRIRLNLDC